MGYTTEFTGSVTVTPPLNEHEIAYLTAFAESRRMARHDGPYRIGDGMYGQDRSADITDYNSPPPGQPGLWCQWVPSNDGATISWDGGEKFYNSPAWMIYLIDTFLKPEADLQAEFGAPVAGRVYPPEFKHFTFDHIVNGTIEAQGEDSDDRWQLVVADNEVTVVELPTLAEQVEADPALAGAFETLKTAGVTVEQFARLTGQDY